MQPRFTLVQGGLAERPLRSTRAGPVRARDWRIAIRHPIEIEPAEIAAWRALLERQAHPDPLADPDHLLTAAQHCTRGSGVVFAFAYAATERGDRTLCGILPIVLPHPVWGGPAIRLWQPPLAPRPVELLLDPATAPALVETILHDLRSYRPRASLYLSRLGSEGAVLRALRADPRLRVTIHPLPAVPTTTFVPIGPKAPAANVERITASRDMRDAVERFLLLDAQRARRPLIGDPAQATIVRVVTRLFAQRDAAIVELGICDGETVSGAIHLGGAVNSLPWRTVDWRGSAIPSSPRADIEIGLAEAVSTLDRPDRLRLVAP